MGSVDFHIMKTPTLFLLSLKNMDRFGVYFKNLTNEIFCDNGNRISALQKWGHPWLFLNKDGVTIPFLTEVEIR